MKTATRKSNRGVRIEGSIKNLTGNESMIADNRQPTVQNKATQIIVIQKGAKVIARKSGETVQHYVVAEPTLAVDVSDLRTGPVANEAVESNATVNSESFTQGSSSSSVGVTYTNTANSGLSTPEVTFLNNSETERSSALTSGDPTEQHQTLGTMDAYPIGQQATPANTTYVYTSDYAPYYQYQPLHSPTQQTYIIQQQNSPGSIDEDVGAQLGHTTRASPATIQWLINNYEPADGTSLPRCTLYSHYIKHCNENKLEPVNAASFGKLIRSVFHGLRTRRLGTRGNSKYHYYGIRIKPDSILNRSTNNTMTVNEDFGRTTIGSQQSMSQISSRGISRRTVLNGSVPTRRINVVGETSVSLPHPSSNSNSSNYAHGVQTGQSSFQPYQSQGGDACAEIDRDMLGDGEVPQIEISDLDGLETYLEPLGLSIQHAMKFIDGYTTNCGEVLECVKQLQFDAVEECWVTFWQPESDQDEMEEDDVEKTTKGLSQIQLFRLCTVPQMQIFVQAMDFSFYQVVTEVLIPDVLSPNMSSTLTTHIRNFAKSLEMQLKKAMQGAPDVIQKKKLIAVRMLAQTLRRYTSLNHLASAARSVLQKPDQIQQMLHDFNRVDITNVQDQAGWVCGCDPALVSNLQSDFRENLQKQKTLEQWAEWMEAVVDQILAKCHDKPCSVLADVSKQFLKNWSFYSSMIIRDLTLRSAQSFGSFHLIRLLFDEYFLYLVELRLAKAANKPVVSVMAQSSDIATITNSSVLTTHHPVSNGIGMIPSRSSQFYNSLDDQSGVNIVYVDDSGDGGQSIQYVDMVSSAQMDTLEQIVQSSEMTLDDVKSDLGEHSKELNLI